MPDALPALQPAPPRDPAAYPLFIDVAPRFRDVDAMGHVNNAVYLTYLEMARQAYWLAAVGGGGVRDFDFILGEVAIRYHSPLTLTERCRVHIRATALAEKKFAFEYLLTEQGSDRLVAMARSVQVMYDYATSRSAPMSAERRSQLEAFESTAAQPQP